MIYFIQDTATHKIKIGVSQRPLDRMASLQTACVGKLVLLGVMDGAQTEEQALHQQFTQHRGEWFEPTEELLAYIRATAITSFSPPLPDTVGVRLEGYTYLATDWEVAQYDTRYALRSGMYVWGAVAVMMASFMVGGALGIAMTLTGGLPEWAIAVTAMVFGILFALGSATSALFYGEHLYVSWMRTLQDKDPRIAAKIEQLHGIRNDLAWRLSQKALCRPSDMPRIITEAQDGS